MDRFIACASSAQYGVLVLKGKPDAETLAKGWITIKSAYLQLMADAETAVELETSIELSNFKLKKQAVESLLYVLQLGHDEDIIAELRTEGYDYPFTADSWQEDAGKVQAELNSEYMHYKLLSGEEDEMEEKPASATPQDVKGRLLPYHTPVAERNRAVCRYRGYRSRQTHDGVRFWHITERLPRTIAQNKR